MKIKPRFGLESPILYMNPHTLPNAGLIDEINEQGGLGIVDYSNHPPQKSGSTQGGVRIGLEELNKIPVDLKARLILIPLLDRKRIASLEDNFFSRFSGEVIVEVGSGEDAKQACRAGAAGLIICGNEGPGWVSETNGLALLQEVLKVCDAPVFLKGGVTPRTARAAMVAGACGVVLDTQLCLCQESDLPDGLKRFFLSLKGEITSCLCDDREIQLRVYSRIGARTVRELRKEEQRVEETDHGAFREKLAFYMNKMCDDPDREDCLIPMSEDIAFARQMATKGKSAREIIMEFSHAMEDTASLKWPFYEGSALAQEHGTRFPIVQGPMAHVSDSAPFLASVLASGAAPTLAMGNMPEQIAQRAISEAKEATSSNFGAGLIGLEVNREIYETHLRLMKDEPPAFVILAAAGVELASRIESMGIKCYLHCPSPLMLEQAIDRGHRSFVLEGSESGGHVGLMGSLTLWSQGLTVIENAIDSGVGPGEISILFAGGVAGSLASVFVGAMVADLCEKGLNAGLQVGTAYLATREAVETSAITGTYQEIALKSRSTVILGRTVNTRARAAGSPMARNLVGLEMERLRSGMKIGERKELYEKDNLGALRLAAKGCAIDPKTAGGSCPSFMDLAPEDQAQRGLYLMGQVVSILNEPITMEELSHELIVKAGQIMEQNSASQKEIDSRPINQDEKIRRARDLKEEPIAVVGLGLRFPGSSTPAQYWEQIVNLRSGIIETPDNRWAGADLFYDPDPKTPDKTYTKIGGFITDFEFDSLKHRIPPSVASSMDRTQQLAVAGVADALEDARIDPADLNGERVGIALGACMGGEKTDQYALRALAPKALEALKESLTFSAASDETRELILETFQREYLKHIPEITEDSLPGELPNIISGRVANAFNLTGPNYTVDAACASSLAAIMSAIGLLRSGSVDLAISGGVDAAMGPSSFIKFCKIGALSPDGSRPFDEGANGFVMGEGAGILILKRLGDAIKDGDTIYATIVGVGSSSDGRGKGITAPNAQGQKRAIRNCLESSGVEIGTIGLIEAHGTSTAVGDKTELTVLDELFRVNGEGCGSVGIGSVKSQIGHLKAASGAAGMIKAILALHNRTLPPTANVKTPNPCINWEDSPLRLITEASRWDNINGAPRRAGVSAFGFGGANFHLVLQEHGPDIDVAWNKERLEKVQNLRIEEKAQISIPSWPTPKRMVANAQAWCFSAGDPEGLSSGLDRVISRINGDNWVSLATDSVKGPHMGPFCAGFAGSDHEDSLKKLKLLQEALKNPRKRSFLPARGIHLTTRDQARVKAGVAIVFPGQGSQYTYMLRDLAERYPVAARTLMDADRILESLGVQTATSLMFPDTSRQDYSQEAHENAMKDTKLLQPLILTANVAIYRVLEQMGLDAMVSVVAGHSLGEYAACVASGALPLEDALAAVAVRGREMANVSMSDPGRMMSVPADASFVEEVLAEVDGYVVAANKNSPKQTVISGETAAVQAAAELFRKRGLEGTPVPVSAAFHSAVVASARKPFMNTLKGLRVSAPFIPVISNVTGDFYPVGPAAGDKIRDLLAKQFAAPVEWIKTMRRMYNEGVRIFIECGPKRVLTALGRDTLDKDALFLATNHPKKGGVVQLLETAAALKAEGLDIDINMESQGPTRVEIDTKAEIGSSAEKDLNREEPIQGAHPDHEGLRLILDEELAGIAASPEFRKFMELQAEPIRAFIKSGYKNFVEKILPMERTSKAVESRGMDFRPVMVTGMSSGLPGDARFPFDRECLDDLISGHNFIKRIPEDRIRSILSKNIERLIKGENGEATLERVAHANDSIRLAGYFSDDRILEEYGVEERMTQAMDASTRLALAAGVEALKDAEIPMVLNTRTTTTGKSLPDSWSLPEPLQEETGVIFASAFPGIGALIDEVTREVAGRYSSRATDRLIKFYTGIIERIDDPSTRLELTKWFTSEFSDLGANDEKELFSFNRNFLFKVMTMAPGQLAQFIRAKGPNTHVNAACASTTQAIVLARDWIRNGMAKRVVVVGADDVAGATLLPWVGGGFLAMGAATTKDRVSEAALPFDSRRNGIILGSAAVGFVLESESVVEERGIAALASIEAGIVANSAYHGTRLDPGHISSLMDKMITGWEKESGVTRRELARDMFFMSHETYSPKRGGSSAAEVQALRHTFRDSVVNIPIANTKGFTGHTMGAGVEDAVSIRCLQKGILPPIPNLKSPDPEFADLKLGTGGPCNANYALRLAAGFGSQIVMSLYKARARTEERVANPEKNSAWLSRITGYERAETFVENRMLRVREAGVEQTEEPAPDSATDLITDIQPIEKTVEPAAKAVESEGADPKARVLRLLSQKTGYPEEMLDLDLDLEADLGIDTVKQAEFITEVRKEFRIPEIKDLKIADFPTIRRVLEFVIDKTGANITAAAPEPADSGEQGARPEEMEGANIKGRVLRLLSQKTGYPEEMLDLDLDLEADLGIDTVKQAEFITEVREEFRIPEIKDLKIADFPTISHIVDFVDNNSERIEIPVKRERQRPEPVSPAPAPAEMGLYNLRLVDTPESEKRSMPRVDEIIILSSLKESAKALKRVLQAKTGAGIHMAKVFKAKEALKKKRVGIINLLPLKPEKSMVDDTLELYLSLAHLFPQGPGFLITVVSEDGALGYESPAADIGDTGIVTGATKAFGKEFEKSVVQVIDISPELNDSEMAEEIGRSVTNPGPMEMAIGKDRVRRALRLSPIMEDYAEKPLQEGSVILATGGARGITASCLKYLAKDTHLKLILMGRTQLTERSGELHGFSPEQWLEERDHIIEAMKKNHEPVTPVRVERELNRLRSQAQTYGTIKELEKLGSEVTYIDADLRGPISRLEELFRNIAKTYQRVDLIIHAAGIDNSKALRSKNMDQMKGVIGTKVTGLANLLSALEFSGLEVEKIIGFGSVSGRFGNLGQVDYAAANDGLAHYLRSLDTSSNIRAKIIDWPPWSEIGMASTGVVKDALESAGIDFVSPDEGARILKQEIEDWSDPCVERVVCGRLGPFQEQAFGVGQEPGLDQMEMAGQRARIISVLPNEHMVAQVTLAPDHPLLDHHRIDGAAVLPGVGGMEIMRAAWEMVSGRDNISVLETRFMSPLKLFRNEPLNVKVQVNRVGDNLFKARITSRHTGPDGKPVGPWRKHHECLLGLDESGIDKSLGSTRDSLISFKQASWIGEAGIYRKFFHDKAFQRLSELSFDTNGKKARFRFSDNPERPRIFRDNWAPCIEAVFQAAAGLAMDKSRAMALPTGLASCQISGDLSRAAFGVVELEEEFQAPHMEGRSGFKLLGAIFDPRGEPIMVLHGIELMGLTSPEPYNPWRSEKVYEESLDLRQVEELLSHNEKEALSQILHKDEEEGLKRAKTDKRKMEWLAGRLAAKKAIKTLLLESGKSGPSLDMVKLIPDESGRPLPALAEPEERLDLNLSISHSNGKVVACVTSNPRARGLGVDLEKIEKRNPLWEKDYFNDKESANLGTGFERDRALTMIWSLKEASLKALGSGLRYNMKDITILEIQENGAALIAFSGEAASHPLLNDGAKLFAWVDSHDGLVTARAILEGE